MSVIFTVQTEKDELETAGHNYHQSKKHKGASMLRKDNNIQKSVGRRSVEKVFKTA